MSCVFCEIIEGKIPSYKVYEDDNFLAFLDIRPLNLGHTLVIPKKHYRWVWDVPTKSESGLTVGNYYKVVAKIANALRIVFKIDQVKSLVLGEEVPHAHIWLVPAFENDGHKATINFKKIKKVSAKEMEWVASRLREELILRPSSGQEK